MISIRKFVGYAGAAAGLSAALALATSTQTGVAYTASQPPSIEPVAADTTSVTLSAACTSAIADLKAWIVADISEDKAEYATAKLNGGNENDTDSTETSNFMTLWGKVRTACTPGAASTSEPTITKSKTFTPSPACSAAIATFKAAWAQHPKTQAQWQQLAADAKAVRVACGWSSTWSTGTASSWSWSDSR